MFSVSGEETARHTHCSMVSTSTYFYMINQRYVFPVLAAAAAAAAARYTIPSNITLQPSCLSTHSLCCAENSFSMAWTSSVPEPSTKLAPQQQIKSSPSAGFLQTLCCQAVLSRKGCSRGLSTVEAVLIATPLYCSLPLSPLLCAVPNWYAGCCCATMGLRVCSNVPPLPLYFKGFRMAVVCIGNYVV